MGTIPVSVSPDLLDAIRRAELLHNFIVEAFPRRVYVHNDRITLLGAKTHLAADLCGAIIYLFKAGGPFDGAAFALIRPLVEVAVEGQWQFFCATDVTFRRAFAGEDVDPGLPNMMDAIDARIGDSVFANLRQNVTLLHEFTHGTHAQLLRRFDADGNLRSTYPDSEKISMISIVSGQFTLLSSIFCQAVTNMEAKSPTSAVIEQKYVELFPAST